MWGSSPLCSKPSESPLARKLLTFWFCSALYISDQISVGVGVDGRSPRQKRQTHAVRTWQSVFFSQIIASQLVCLRSLQKPRNGCLQQFCPVLLLYNALSENEIKYMTFYHWKLMGRHILNCLTGSRYYEHFVLWITTDTHKINVHLISINIGPPLYNV